MGIYALPLSLSLLLLASAVRSSEASVQQGSIPASDQPISELIYQKALLDADIAELTDVCADAARFGLDQRMRELRDRLMLVAPSPQPFEVVVANAQALMVCKAPVSAQSVLSRFGPAKGKQRRQWLLLSWQAASAALDHAGASLALRRLADGNLTALDRERLPVAEGSDGSVLTRSALDVLVEHERSMGHVDAAISVLLASRVTGAAGAARLGLAADLLADMGLDQSTPLLESALDQAAADEAWGLAIELLRLQLKLELASGGEGTRPRQRLRRLASRVDDRYSLLELLRKDEKQQESAAALDQQLRSPREPGGHAAAEDPSPTPTP